MPLTTDSEFPVTRKYSRGMQEITSGDYKIVTRGTSYWGTVYNSFVVYFKGGKLNTFGTQREAKTAVEMHDAGFGTDVRYFNIPGKG